MESFKVCFRMFVDPSWCILVHVVATRSADSWLPRKGEEENEWLKHYNEKKVSAVSLVLY